MAEHRTIRVYGQVQGVFFRANAAAFARMHHITGLARNEPDGSVYIEAEGDPKDLQLFTNWCRTGPSRASVSRCVVANADPKGYTSFEVDRD